MTTLDDEKKMQEYMDAIYDYRGYVIDRGVSCKQYDLLLSGNGSYKKVEEKFNFTDKDYDQMIVELLQDAKTGDLGWFYHTNCDYLYWVYCPVDRISRPTVLYKINWQEFKYFVFDAMEPGWKSVHINDQGYGLTINFPIKWNHILKNGIATKENLEQMSLWYGI